MFMPVIFTGCSIQETLQSTEAQECREGLFVGNKECYLIMNRLELALEANRREKYKI